MKMPTVALVGRPNVGKSTIFNRLVGKKISIIEDTPGVTRDRIYADCEYKNYKFHLIDTGGIDVTKELFNDYCSKYPYPKKNDILISCSGTIGKTVRFNGEPAYFQDSNIVWLENDESKVLNDYLYYCYCISLISYYLIQYHLV